MSRARTLLVASLCCAAWWACTDASSPTESSRAVELGIVPNFQVDPALFATAPIDRIRLTARRAVTRAIVGSTDRTVSPTAPSWALSLGIDLGGAATLQVVVEAELLSTGVVVWSGRLGPFTIPNPAPALALDVYPGPLGNQDVLLVDIVGDPAQLVVGTSTTLTADVTLQPGSTANPVVLWASSNPAVATVTSQGSTVTLTAMSLGTADIIATAGPAYDEFTVQVVPVPQFTKTWVGGDAAGPTNWSNPANWSPAGVPASTDIVLVDTPTNRPVLSANATVASLTVGDGSSVDLGGLTILTVANDLDAGATGILDGDVIVAGPGSVLEGTFDGVQVISDRALSGSVTTTGDVTLTDANLDVSGQLLAVGGSLAVSGPNGHLLMSGAGSQVRVAGSAFFSGGDHTNLLTGGLLVVDGDFRVTDSSANGFPPSSSHVVDFDGTGPQSVIFDLPASGQQSFGSVVVSNSSGVSFDSNVFTTGNVTVGGRLIVPVGTTTAIGGSLTLGAGSQLVVDGTLTALGGCVNVGGVITGSGTQPCGGGGPAGDRTWVGGASPDPADWNDPNNWSPVGVPGPTNSVVVQGAATNPVLGSSASVASITVGNPNAVDLGGFTLTVAGDVDANVNGLTNGTVEVSGAGTVLRGAFQDLRVSADRSLTGTLYVLGNLFVANVLDTNGQAASVSGDLTVEGPEALLVMNDPAASMFVVGNALFSGADHTGALTEGSLGILGDLYVTDSSPTGFVSSGNHFVYLAGGSAQVLAFEVPGATQQRFRDLTISTTAGATFSTDAHAMGDVTLTGHMVVPAGITLTIEGTLTLGGGSIFQVDATGTVVVTGGCTNLGATILGSGTQSCGTPTAADRVWIGGATGFESDWSNAANWAPSGVPTPSESVLIPYAAYSPVLASNQSIGSLAVQNTSAVDLGTFTLSVAGDLSVDGVIDNGLVDVTGPGTILQGYFDQLRVSADRALSGVVYTARDLDIRRRLTVGANVNYVNGNLLVQTATGELVMDDNGGAVYVVGNTTFDGASLDGDLTGGFLYLEGDLTTGTTYSPTSFRSTGVEVYIAGGVDQTVSIANPGTQSFADLFVEKSGGSAIFETDAFVTGALYADGSTLAQGGGATLEVTGRLQVNNVTFDGLPLRLVTNQTTDRHLVNSVTFTNMNPAAVQLYLDVPPVVGGAVVPLSINSPVFSTMPSGGGYYIEATNPIAAQLVIQLNGPMPVDDSGFTKVSGNTVINWGP